MALASITACYVNWRERCCIDHGVYANPWSEPKFSCIEKEYQLNDYNDNNVLGQITLNCLSPKVSKACIVNARHLIDIRIIDMYNTLIHTKIQDSSTNWTSI